MSNAINTSASPKGKASGSHELLLIKISVLLCTLDPAEYD